MENLAAMENLEEREIRSRNRSEQLRIARVERKNNQERLSKKQSEKNLLFLFKNDLANNKKVMPLDLVSQENEQTMQQFLNLKPREQMAAYRDRQCSKSVWEKIAQFTAKLELRAKARMMVHKEDNLLKQMQQKINQFVIVR